MSAAGTIGLTAAVAAAVAVVFSGPVANAVAVAAAATALAAAPLQQQQPAHPAAGDQLVLHLSAVVDAWNCDDVVESIVPRETRVVVVDILHYYLRYFYRNFVFLPVLPMRVLLLL